ncbi:MAG TPA: tetratricopeptide repeat protein [Candidatus Omnitrophota bacterium]|nr:tetratricopeptide repeat protein [Candidatus Omnitrophota bacterium]HPN56702.1 tetratricopeptide repeat protein [Candidatus Omnitrophota bacterium]
MLKGKNIFVRPATPLYQKLLLVTGGVVLSLSIVEGLLRGGGLLFSFFQDVSNRVTFEGQEYRILCIGESTTALGGENSYPSQLGQILKQRRPDFSFQIINKGLVSKTSADILLQLPGYLQAYRPHAVVAMIGINDAGTLGETRQAAQGGRPVFARLRLYKLFRYIHLHVTAKLRERRGNGLRPQATGDGQKEAGEESPVTDARTSEIVRDRVRRLEELRAAAGAQLARNRSPEERSVILRRMSQLKVTESYLRLHLGWYHRMHQNYGEAEEHLRAAVQLDRNNYGAFVELARCYSEQDRCGDALPLLHRAVLLSADSVLAMMELAKCYEAVGRSDVAKDFYWKVFLKDSQLFKLDGTIGRWLMEHGFYQEAEIVLKETIEEYPEDFFFYEQLAQLYAAIGEEEKARSIFARGNAVREQQERYLPETVDNYRTIASLILKRGIRLVCMQYPLRDIGPLKDIFPGRPEILFVENKRNFAEALREGDYNEYFSDSFAGNFGHCTPKGNRLIAEQLADIILSEAGRGSEKKVGDER